MEAGKEFGIVPCALAPAIPCAWNRRMALYGHEISETINVWEAGLDRYAKLDKGDFIGRAALIKAKEEGIRRVLLAGNYRARH